MTTRSAFHPYARPSSGSSARGSGASAMNEDFLGKPPLAAAPAAPLPPLDLLQVDVVELRAELRAARAQLAEAKLTYERQLVELQKGHSELRTKLEAEATQMQKTQANLLFVAGEEAKKAARVVELEEKIASTQRDAETKVRLAQRELTTTREELDILGMEHASLQRQHQNDLDLLKLKISKKDEQIQQLQAIRPSSTTGFLSDTARMMESHERQLQAKDAEIQRKLDGQVDYMNQLESQARTLQAENQLLREQTKNILTLSEERNSLKQRVAQLEETHSHQTTQLIKTEREMTSWMSLLEPADRATIDTPAALARALLSVRHEYRLLLADQGNIRGQQRVLESQLLETQGQLATSTAEAQSLRQQVEKDQRAAKRLDKARTIAQKEIEFLRAQLDSYDSEQTMMGVASIDEQKTKRIQHLELLLQEAQQQLEEAVAPVSTAPATPFRMPEPSSTMHIDLARSNDQLRELQTQLSDMQKVIDTLKFEKQTLESQLSYTERQLARGDFNPATTKVLHFKLNPASIATMEREQAMNRLQEENRRLLQELEGHGESAAQSAIVVTTNSKITELEQKLLESELRMRRLKEVFGRKILEFRELCYSLTGWQIEMNDATFRLSSMFAEHQGDCLLFTRDPATSAILLRETDFSRTIAPLLAPMLQRRNSIPAMTASVTLELFSRQTAM